ncbi:MAG: efflux RND transporter permease subunit [Planctomycetaceae bacterium]|nr:efflux RND transporter permease subunit [Planctomycetaceae bacterium]
MLNRIIFFSLRHRLIVFAAAVFLVIFGTKQMLELPIDVLPDLNRPRVTVMTECPGFAPEEVETLVTTPLETVLNGATGALAIRSQTTVGLSIITIEFDWGSDVFQSRQIVAERLQLAIDRLPDGIVPQMTPISSVMGQIAVLAVWSDDTNLNPAVLPPDFQPLTDMELRTLADWTIRRRLLAVQGVSEVYTMGGERKQFQVLLRADDLRKYDVRIDDVETALTRSNQNVTGGYLMGAGNKQSLIRSVGRIRTIDDIKKLVVKPNTDPPILLDLVADVVEAPATKVGDGFISFHEPMTGIISANKAVILTVEKQPLEDTRQLTSTLLQKIEQIQNELQTKHPDLRIECLYQQRTFIDLAINNVLEALYLGVLLVVVVLFFFLMNLRITFITLLAIPMSIITTCLIFAWLGFSINTMTLGGLAVAIGELVDDAIVDVENIFRRLKENFLSETPRSSIEIVYEASCEIRNSIVYGTAIVCVCFFPLFWLSGIEGRLFAPLGVAYVVSIFASLLVSLTITPILSKWLLPKTAYLHRESSGLVLRFVQLFAETAIRFGLKFPRLVLLLGVIASVAALLVFLALPRDFMPPFNEGAIQVNVDLMPGTPLETTEKLARRLASQVQSIEGIQSISGRIGRAELDEHAVPVSTAELICSVDPKTKRKMEAIITDLETLIAPTNIPGAIAFHDQPLQHLISHLRSGTSARIAIKLRGNNLRSLNERAARVQELITDIPDIGKTRIEPIQIDIPQIRIELDRDKLARHGLTPVDVNSAVETAMSGCVATEVIDSERRYFDVLIRLAEEYREDANLLQDLPISLPEGGVVPLGELAVIVNSHGPSRIDHEAGHRQVVVQSNPSHRGAVDVKNDIDRVLQPHLEELTSDNYTLELSGIFQSEQEATQQIILLSCLSVLVIFLLLYTMFQSANISLQIMVALPLALVGAVAAIVLTGQGRTIPCLVGMISLCGIASRNGILLIDHYLHLVQYEGETFSKEMLIRAGRERVAPVLMTALTSVIALVPLTLAADKPGREILYPIATVVIGGLLTSTLMEFFIRPALFWKFGREAFERSLNARRAAHRNSLSNDTSSPEFKYPGKFS